MNTLMMKLPDAVTDDTLLKLGEVKFHAECSDNSVGVWSLVKDAIQNPGGARIIGDGYFTNSSGTENYGKSVEFPEGNNVLQFYTKGTSFDLYLSNKYTLTLIRTVLPDTSTGWSYRLVDGSFNGCSKLATLALYRTAGQNVDLAEFADSPLVSIVSATLISPFRGDVSNLVKDTLNTIDITGDALYGNISSFVDLTSLTTLKFNFSNVSGDISSVATCVALTNLSLENSNVSGTVESLLDAMFANGRQSGQFTINVKGTSATYNGSVPTSDLVATFSGSGWTVA